MCVTLGKGWGAPPPQKAVFPGLDLPALPQESVIAEAGERLHGGGSTQMLRLFWDAWMLSSRYVCIDLGSSKWPLPNGDGEMIS